MIPPTLLFDPISPTSDIAHSQSLQVTHTYLNKYLPTIKILFRNFGVHDKKTQRDAHMLISG